MFKTMKTILACFTVLVMSMQMSVAQGLSAGDLAFAFGDGTSPVYAQELQHSIYGTQTLSAEEMETTVGEVWPFVYQGAVFTLRAVMWTTSTVARPIFRREVNRGHTILMFRSSGRHICQVGCHRTRGHHFGWGAGGNGSKARYHVYQTRPWRINPY